MNDPAGVVPDPLDGLLQPPAGEADDALRRRLLQQTTRVLRRRGRLRIVARLAALAACFAMGALTVYWFGPRRIDQVVVVEKPPAPETPPVPAPVSPSPTPAASALALEWKAFDADKARPDLYRQAADRYLHEDSDPASAVRCYGQSLNGASDKELAISPNDDYLLMLVKEARQKEKDDAKTRN
jgi:hypothetical protein